MFPILSFAIALMFSNIQLTDAWIVSVDIPGSDLSNESMYKLYQEQKKKEEEHRRSLDAANHFSQEDFDRIIQNRGSELKSINAILTRYKDDFAQVRDRNDQDGRYTKTKVSEIFKLDLYKYVPDKNLWHLAHHIFSSFHDSTTNKEEKLSNVENRIANIKKSLIYMRDFSVKKEVTPFKVFVYLYHVDIKLALYKYECTVQRLREYCQAYHDLLSSLDV